MASGPNFVEISFKRAAIVSQRLIPGNALENL